MQTKPNHTIKTTLLENRSPIVNVLLLLVDILTISLAVVLSASIRILLEPIMGGDVNWNLILNGMIFFMIFNLLLAWLNGLYPGFGLAAVHEMQKVLYVVSLGSVFLGVFLFLQQLALAYSRFIFMLTWLLSALFMMLGRFALRNRFSRFDWWGIPMVIIGSQKNVTPVIEKLFQNRRLGFRPVFYFDPEMQSEGPIHGVPVIHDRESLQQVVTDSGIKHVVFTDPLNKVASFNFSLDQGCLS